MPVPVTRLAACRHASGCRGHLSVVACPRHLPHRMSVSWWPWKGPQYGRLWLSPVFMCLSVHRWSQRRPRCGHLSLSPTSPHLSEPVAMEVTSAWLPVPVTCLCVCQWVGGHRGGLSVAACGCHLSSCVRDPGGDLDVTACPRHPPPCVSAVWWPQRGPQCGRLSLSPASPHVSKPRRGPRCS